MTTPDKSHRVTAVQPDPVARHKRRSPCCVKEAQRYLTEHGGLSHSDQPVTQEVEAERMVKALLANDAYIPDLTDAQIEHFAFDLSRALEARTPR